MNFGLETASEGTGEDRLAEQRFLWWCLQSASKRGEWSISPEPSSGTELAGFRARVCPPPSSACGAQPGLPCRLRCLVGWTMLSPPTPGPGLGREPGAGLSPKLPDNSVRGRICPRIRWPVPPWEHLGAGSACRGLSRPALSGVPGLPGDRARMGWVTGGKLLV